MDSKLTRRVGLLRTLITSRLENCNTVEKYVNKIVSTAHKLTGIGFEVNDKWIGTFLLAGLSDDYKPMGIESSSIRITGDAIKTKLLQDVKSIKSSKSAFYSKTFKKNLLRRKGHIVSGAINMDTNSLNVFKKKTNKSIKRRQTLSKWIINRRNHKLTFALDSQLAKLIPKTGSLIQVRSCT